MVIQLIHLLLVELLRLIIQLMILLLGVEHADDTFTPTGSSISNATGRRNTTAGFSMMKWMQFGGGTSHMLRTGFRFCNLQKYCCD